MFARTYQYCAGKNSDHFTHSSSLETIRLRRALKANDCQRKLRRASLFTMVRRKNSTTKKDLEKFSRFVGVNCFRHCRWALFFRWFVGGDVVATAPDLAPSQKLFRTGCFGAPHCRFLHAHKHFAFPSYNYNLLLNTASEH